MSVNKHPGQGTLGLELFEGVNNLEQLKTRDDVFAPVHTKAVNTLYIPQNVTSEQGQSSEATAGFAVSEAKTLSQVVSEQETLVPDVALAQPVVKSAPVSEAMFKSVSSPDNMAPVVVTQAISQSRDMSMSQESKGAGCVEHNPDAKAQLAVSDVGQVEQVALSQQGHTVAHKIASAQVSTNGQQSLDGALASISGQQSLDGALASVSGQQGLAVAQTAKQTMGYSMTATGVEHKSVPAGAKVEEQSAEPSLEQLVSQTMSQQTTPTTLMQDSLLVKPSVTPTQDSLLAKPSATPMQDSVLGQNSQPTPSEQTQASDESYDAFAPLAERLRPRHIGEYIGQSHLLGPDKPLRAALERKRCYSMILWGPPGVGKTTLALMLAKATGAVLEQLSAVVGGIADIRDAVSRAKERRRHGVRTILFVDEVHRFNKAQQDAFLPHIENGTLIFVGATTENPSFQVNSALLSRARVFVLKKLNDEELNQLLDMALNSPRGLQREKLYMEDRVRQALISLADGDARHLLTTLEMLADDAALMKDGRKQITYAMVGAVAGRRLLSYDKNGDAYYDLISAFHKSVRGSAPDAALYWYARILESGGDPAYVARRILAIATEDVGLADPLAMQIALNAWDIFNRVGAAEGERAIAEAAVYMALAPKSNHLYNAFNQVRKDVVTLPSYDVPLYIRNAPTKLMSQLGYHDGYRYAHDFPEAYAPGECFMPEELHGRRYYLPSDRGYEKQLQERQAWLSQRDALVPSQYRFGPEHAEQRQQELKARYPQIFENDLLQPKDAAPIQVDPQFKAQFTALQQQRVGINAQVGASNPAYAYASSLVNHVAQGQGNNFAPRQQSFAPAPHNFTSAPQSFMQGQVNNLTQGQGNSFTQGQGNNFTQGQGNNLTQVSAQSSGQGQVGKTAQGQGNNFAPTQQSFSLAPHNFTSAPQSFMQGQGNNFTQGQGNNFAQGQGNNLTQVSSQSSGQGQVGKIAQGQVNKIASPMVSGNNMSQAVVQQQGGLSESKQVVSYPPATMTPPQSYMPYREYADVAMSQSQFTGNSTIQGYGNNLAPSNANPQVGAREIAQGNFYPSSQPFLGANQGQGNTYQKPMQSYPEQGGVYPEKNNAYFQQATPSYANVSNNMTPERCNTGHDDFYQG